MALGILWTQTSFQKEKLKIFQRVGEAPLALDFFYDPLLEIRPCAFLKKEDVERYQGVFVTSQHGAAALKDVASLDFPLYVVGEKTFEVAKEIGFQTVYSAEGCGQDLKKLLLKERDPSRGILLYVRGKHIQENLKKELEEEGFQIHEKIVYEALLKRSFLEKTKKGFKNKKITDVFLFSRRGATAFKKNLEALKIENSGKNLRVFCLSPKISQEMDGKDYNAIYTAQRPTLEALWALFMETLKN